MTRGIEEALNLPSLEDALKEHGLHPKQQEGAEIAEDINDDPEAIMAEMEAEAKVKIAQAAEAVRKMREASGADHEKSMDELHGEILRHSRDLMDLGFNLDHARARGIFEIAASMYGHAMSAKNHKREFQLKAMRLALDQRKLELEEKRQMGEAALNPEENTPAGAILVEDRNELLRRLRAKKAAE